MAFSSDGTKVLLCFVVLTMALSCEALYPCPPGKNAWPELLGANGEVAAHTIMQENHRVTAIVILTRTPVNRDYLCGRVLVWVNAYDVVIIAPRIG